MSWDLLFYASHVWTKPRSCTAQLTVTAELSTSLKYLSGGLANPDAYEETLCNCFRAQARLVNRAKSTK